MNDLIQPSRYEQAIALLAEANRVDEVMGVRDEAERLRLYARQAKNKDLIADAMEIQIRAERKLGGIIKAAKDAGQIGRGAGFHNDGRAQMSPEGTFRVRLSDAGIDRKLSSKAQQLAAFDADRFAEVVARAREKIVSGGAIVINPLKDLSTEDKKRKRDVREWVKAQEIHALPNEQFGILYADPEWKFGTWSPKGMSRSADNHYRTSPLATLQARDIRSIAAPDCILFMWATVPMLIEAICVADAWGFTLLNRDPETGFLYPEKDEARYVSGWAWLKEKLSTGYWVRNEHELLLIFTRGKPVAPAMGGQSASVVEGFGELGAAFQERSTQHSKKPDAFADEIMRLWPNTPKLELNARGPREGWVVWGDEAQTNMPETADEALERAADEGGDKTAGLPLSATPFKSTKETDAVIRDGYRDSLSPEAIAAQLGTDKDRVKKRAWQLGISNRERQRKAVAESNSRRAGVK